MEVLTPMIRKYRGFLARDENGSLWFHKEKPHKKDGAWKSAKGTFYINGSYFSEVTKYDEEPTPTNITVELTLKGEKK